MLVQNQSVKNDLIPILEVHLEGYFYEDIVVDFYDLHLYLSSLEI